jgi:predicted DNA-binding WGR domain protein
MKLIEQKRLHFQKGSSNKVYEVDLCEVGTDEYLVNFRYGRFDATLKEGTKTAFPVNLEKAEQLFDKLVNDKLKKGYVDVSANSLEEQATEIEAEKASISRDLSPKEAQKAHILYHLQLAVKSLDLQASKNWDIKRVVWRAGELKIQEAVPDLIQLGSMSKRGKKKQELYQYCILWALGRTAPQSQWISESLDLIDSILTDNKSNEMLLRMAREAYRAIAEGSQLEVFLSDQLSKLTEDLQKAIEGDNYYNALKALNQIKNQPNQLWQLERAYLFTEQSAQLKRAFLEVLGNMSIQANYFRTIRHLYKMAEFRQDGQFYGLLAYKIEKQAALFKMPPGDNPGMYYQYKWIHPKAELKKDNSKLAFSEGTKKYLGKRTRRTLKRLGEANDLNYVLLATGILLQYDDQRDGNSARVEKNWRYDKKKRRWRSVVSYFDSYSRELLFNEILYANSNRFAYSKEVSEWVCANGYQPGADFDETQREEAFPELWDQMPKALVHLLIEAKSEKVCNFALRSLKLHKDYYQIKSRFNIPLVIKLLTKDFDAPNLFALDLAKELYQADQPNHELVLSMLNHRLQVIREQALAWIDAGYFKFFSDTDFVRDLLTHQVPQVRRWARGQFERIAELYDDAKRRALIGRLISFCVRQAEEAGIIQELKTVLFQYFAEELSHISLDVVGQLLEHKELANQYFAAELLEKHSIEPDRIPTDYMVKLVYHQEADLRDKGLELLGRYSDMALAKQAELIFQLSTAKVSEIRLAVRPIIGRLASKFNDFAENALMRYVRLLLRKESYEGLHEDIFSLLTNELENFLNLVDRKLIFRLLNSDHSKAQELACLLVDRYIPFESMTVRNIIRLADHEIKAARQLAWKMFQTQIPRIKYEREEAVRLMDAKWEDSRQFAFEFFKKEFEDQDWTPELLISICDSVREDVQAFGRSLISRFFKEEDGATYLLKLSQHPKPELQLFATNYLSRYASDNIVHIQKLKTYFTTVLTQVNKGRVAKDRIIQFLHQEALKSYEVAELVTEILNFVSATYAIGDKGKYIEMMRDLKVKYPVLEMPLKLQEIPELN